VVEKLACKLTIRCFKKIYFSL